MRNFFIDYENVQGAGLSSLDKLVVDDSIYIFYSSHAETMRMPFVKMIYQTEAKVEFIEVETGKPNALDFQLVARLFMNISKDVDNYIISRDTGFDAAVHVGVINGFRIKRVPSITDAFENNDASDDMENDPDLQ